MKTKIKSDMIAAMKGGDTVKRDTLRMLLTAITVKEKTGDEVGDVEIQSIIKKQIKQRQDAELMFLKGGAIEEARKEFSESEILQEYLPEQLTQTEVEGIVDDAIVAVNATTRKDMGKVMKQSQSVIQGRFDGKQLSQIVIQKLN